MRKLIPLFALALLFISSGSAQAAADITRPGSCSVSANWSISLSVNFNNTHGSPSRGVVDYVVLNSPGPLNNASIRFYAVSGSQVSTGGTALVRDTSKPGYVYRADPGASPQTRRVVIDPQSNTGVFCSFYSSEATIYSAN